MMNIFFTQFNDFKFYSYQNDWVGLGIKEGNKSGVATYEKHHLTFNSINLTKDSIYVDVGSNCGYYTVTSAKLCKWVYSFEPQTPLYDIQLKNINANSLTNVSAFKVGLGDTEDIKHLSYVDYSKPSVNLGDPSIGEGGEEVIIKPLDSYNIQPDIVKIDVQGYEKYVINGASQTIIKHNPTLVVEFENHQLGKFKYKSTELFNYIRSFDYYIYLLDYYYPSDMVCVHKSKLDDFKEKNKSYIFALTESNNLNQCLDNGITEKLTYI